MLKKKASVNQVERLKEELWDLKERVMALETMRECLHRSTEKP